MQFYSSYKCADTSGLKRERDRQTDRQADREKKGHARKAVK